MEKKLLSLGSLVALLGLSAVFLTYKVQAISVPASKVTICHRNDDANNPYIQEQPDADGDVSGHDDHDGPVATSTTVAQALKDSHQKWGDIIPPFSYYYCTGSGYHLDGSVCKKNNQPDQSAAIGNYGGENWTTDGQNIYNNSCHMPAPTVTATPTSTLDCDGDTDGDQPNQDDICVDNDNPTPTPTVTATPTPTSTLDCDGDTDGDQPNQDDICVDNDDPTATPTPTNTPTVTVTLTPTVTPTDPTATPTPGNNGCTSNCGSSSSNDGGSSTSSNTPSQAVLGTSTMASTGVFEENAMNVMAVAGIILMTTSLYAKKAKKALFN